MSTKKSKGTLGSNSARARMQFDSTPAEKYVHASKVAKATKLAKKLRQKKLSSEIVNVYSN